jgi:RNA polymerase sigma-70 factor (ECF subfamily)
LNQVQQDNDYELLLRLKNGDRQAFSQIYSKYLDSLYKYIYLFTKSNEQTSEVIQEVFIRIWEKRGTLTNIESFKSYLFRSAKNKLIDVVRQNQVRHRILSELKRKNDDYLLMEEDEIAYREYYRIVQQAIEKLPPKRKQILRLNIEHGLSQGEIAQQLHISKSVVQKQLYKALDFVRRYLTHRSGVSFNSLSALFTFLF